jgi:hypothetical protein
MPYSYLMHKNKLKFHPFSLGEKGFEDRGTEASPLLSKGEGNSRGEV